MGHKTHPNSCAFKAVLKACCLEQASGHAVELLDACFSNDTP
jgi:hypothetical protein